MKIIIRDYYMYSLAKKFENLEGREVAGFEQGSWGEGRSPRGN